MCKSERKGEYYRMKNLLNKLFSTELPDDLYSALVKKSVSNFFLGIVLVILGISSSNLTLFIFSLVTGILLNCLTLHTLFLCKTDKECY